MLKNSFMANKINVTAHTLAKLERLSAGNNLGQQPQKGLLFLLKLRCDFPVLL
jgi:hypothetical protein